MYHEKVLALISK